MSTSWKTVRVFISSTFRDMQAERDWLVRFVFPKLREELVKYRIHLVDVDLRWGVTGDEDAGEVCREVISECRPRFLCLLGGRYGWVPPPKRIAANILSELLSGASKAGTLTPAENEALLALYPRTGTAEEFRLREKPDTHDAREVYAAQCAVTLTALHRAGLATSITADEIDFGVLNPPPNDHGPVRAFFYFRHEAATARMVEEKAGDFREPAGSDNARALAALKKTIADARHEPRIYGEDAEWDAATKRLVGLEKFGDSVFADLFESIKHDPKLEARFTAPAAPPDEFAEEAEQMEAFIEERTERFVLGSRQALMNDMLAFAATEGTPNIFVLTGEPGSGKSAFLAEFASLLLSPQKDTKIVAFFRGHLPHLIPHFVGASTGSTDLRRTLRRLCHELAKAAGNAEPLPLDIKDLITHFQKLLTKAGAKKRVVLVLDALNQFDATDGAHRLNWLPHKLPPGVRIFVSVIAPAEGDREHQTLAILKNRPGTRIMKVPALSWRDSVRIMCGYLRRFSKRMDKTQKRALLSKPAGHLPLYVLTMLEELRTLGTDEQLTTLSANPIPPDELECLRRDDHDRILALFIEKELPGDARSLFGWILTNRLANDPGLATHPGGGAALVEKFAACLGVSRHGLSSAELNAILAPARMPDVKNDELGNVAALIRLLRPYLMRRGELLDFYHGQFREAAESAFLDTPDRRGGAHHQLGEHFEKRASPVGANRWDSDDKRAFRELPIHRAAEARASGKPEVLYRLVDDTQFRAKAFELARSADPIARSADPIARDLDVALELAVTNDDAGKVFHFALIRTEFLRELTESYLHRISVLGEKEPELAYSVVSLVPDATYRRLGLVALAVRNRRDVGSASLVERLLLDALRIREPATVAQTPVLLFMARSLCESGFPQAASLSSCVLDSPARAVWMAALRDSAQGPGEMFNSVPPAPADEIERFQAIRKTLQPFFTYQRKFRSQHDFDQFEESLFQAHGLDGPSAAYCMEAAEFFASDNEELALPALGRAIFIACKVGKNHLRTEAALAEMYAANGEHDAAAEALARARVIAKLGHALARTPRERAWLEDAKRELLIAGERAATVWRPPGSRELADEVRTESVGIRDDDLPAILSRTRWLLAEGNREAIPRMLGRLLANTVPPNLPSLLAIHALAHAAGDLPHSQQSARLLANADVDAAALFDPDRHSELSSMFAVMAQADIRIVSALAFSLRETGSRHALLELTRSVATGRGDILCLDSVLPELIRLCATTGEIVRSMDRDTLAATDHLTVPSGMGMYYYPGTIYFAAWGGLVCFMAALIPLLEEPHRLVPGFVAIALLSVGGLLDMLLWDRIGIWKKPEKSRRLFISQGGTVVMSLALMWVVELVDKSERQRVGAGWLTGISIVPMALFAQWCTLYFSIKWQNRPQWFETLFSPFWEFLPFTKWQPRIKLLGSVAAVALGCVLAFVMAQFSRDWRPFLSGVFFAGGLELGMAFAIFPLRRRVCRFLDTTLPKDHS